MGLPDATIEQIDALLELLREGRLEPAQADQLEAILRDSPDAQRYYLRMTHFDASLRWMGSGTSQPAPATKPLWLNLRRMVSQVNRPWNYSLITASSCVFALLALLAIWRVDAPRVALDLAEPSPKTAPPLAQSAVAVVSPASALAGWTPGERAFLSSGQPLKIAEGELRVVFGNGAEVVLRGPAEFVPHTTQSGYLRYGYLRAQVENGLTNHFEILTDSARVVDLGTNFEVLVVDASQTVVRVNVGEVEVTPRTENGGGSAPRRMFAEDAALIHGLRQSIEPLNPEKAVALFQDKAGSSAVAIRHSRVPVQDGLVVHLDAGNLTGADNAGLSDRQVVRAWRNLAPAASSLGHFFGVAHLHATGVNDRPTLQFNGKSDYFRNPRTLGNSASESLTLFVVAKNESEQRGHLVATHHDKKVGRGWSLCFSGTQGALFYHTMYQHGMARLTLDNDDFQLLEAVRAPQGDPRGLMLRANGGALASASDTRLLPSNSGTTLGGPLRFFTGHLAEVVIYNRVLTPPESEQVRRFLAEKHDLPLAAIEAKENAGSQAVEASSEIDEK